MKSKAPQPLCILLRGLPCVGKSSLALALARRLGFALLIKDDVRVPTMANDMATRARLIASGASAEQASFVDSNSACYGAINAIAATQISAGARGCVLDSPLGRVDVANEAVRALSAAGAACVLVDCVLERSVWVERLRARRNEATNSGRLNSHSVAHSALPDDPELIESHYPNGLQFPVAGVESFVQVDCSLAVEQGVETIVQAIKSLRSSAIA